jgi:hypothetical protein
MPSQLGELLALMVVAALSLVFAWVHGDELFPSIFATEGLVAATIALRRFW